MSGAGQLVFSTATRSPGRGAEATQKIIAESPGVPAAVRSELTYYAHVDGPLLHRSLAEPARFLITAGPGHWVYGRTISIGHYRGHQQLLTHGLVLDERQLRRLDGNPFLLESPELLQATGLSWMSGYPDARDLPVARLDGFSDEDARRLNDRRFADAVERDEPWATHALAALLAGESLACIGDRPETRWRGIEDSLLHLPLADRLTIRFHTAHSYTTGVPADLLLGGAPDRPNIERQLPEARVIAADLPPIPRAPALTRHGRALPRLRAFHDEHACSFRGPDALSPREREALLGDPDRLSPELLQLQDALWLRGFDTDNATPRLLDAARRGAVRHADAPSRLPAAIADARAPVVRRMRDRPTGFADWFDIEALLDGTSGPARSAERRSLLLWITGLADALGTRNDPGLARFYDGALPAPAILAEVGADSPDAWVDVCRPWIAATSNRPDAELHWLTCLDWIRRHAPEAWKGVAVAVEERLGALPGPLRIRWLLALTGAAEAAGEHAYRTYLSTDRLLPELDGPDRAAWIRAHLDQLLDGPREELARLLADARVREPLIVTMADRAASVRESEASRETFRRFFADALVACDQDSAPALAALIDTRSGRTNEPTLATCLIDLQRAAPTHTAATLTHVLAIAGRELDSPLGARAKARWLRRLHDLFETVASDRADETVRRHYLLLLSHAPFMIEGRLSRRRLVESIQSRARRASLKAILRDGPGSPRARLYRRLERWILGDDGPVAAPHPLPVPDAPARRPTPPRASDRRTVEAPRLAETYSSRAAARIRRIQGGTHP